MKINETAQLNLYDRGSEGLGDKKEMAAGKELIIDKEILKNILQDKIFGEELTIGRLDGLMIIYNSESRNKIELYAPSSLRLFAQAVVELGYKINMNNLEKELKGREEQIRREIMKRTRRKKIWGAEAALPKGDR